MNDAGLIGSFLLISFHIDEPVLMGFLCNADCLHKAKGFRERSS